MPLAVLGFGSKWVSRIGKDEFGRVIYNLARGEGVDVSAVEFVEGVPTSLNFKEIHENGAGKPIINGTRHRLQT